MKNTQNPNEQPCDLTISGNKSQYSSETSFQDLAQNFEFRDFEQVTISISNLFKGFGLGSKGFEYALGFKTSVVLH